MNPISITNFSVGSLLAGLLFGSLGVYFFRLAKRDGNMTLLGIGIALFAYPYFVENAWLCWAIGILLTFWGFRARDS